MRLAKMRTKDGAPGAPHQSIQSSRYYTKGNSKDSKNTNESFSRLCKNPIIDQGDGQTLPKYIWRGKVRWYTKFLIIMLIKSRCGRRGREFSCRQSVRIKLRTNHRTNFLFWSR
ncbi:uncharacterized protein LOC129755180 [Uranotaenia lowii]|uniref:uncharacterized protein LOC129755180 n=1 Tax=Uranotaenia lowii TaxID=190385 RepID=UPI00247A76DC|nr:uncharacterized protein LOC129755180 [Uranotaenia lowii]